MPETKLELEIFGWTTVVENMIFKIAVPVLIETQSEFKGNGYWTRSENQMKQSSAMKNIAILTVD